jgi:hypothetical protein
VNTRRPRELSGFGGTGQVKALRFRPERARPRRAGAGRQRFQRLLRAGRSGDDFVQGVEPKFAFFANTGGESHDKITLFNKAEWLGIHGVKGLDNATATDDEVRCEIRGLEVSFLQYLIAAELAIVHAG